MWRVPCDGPVLRGQPDITADVCVLLNMAGLLRLGVARPPDVYALSTPTAVQGRVSRGIHGPEPIQFLDRPFGVCCGIETYLLSRIVCLVSAKDGSMFESSSRGLRRRKPAAECMWSTALIGCLPAVDRCSSYMLLVQLRRTLAIVFVEVGSAAASIDRHVLLGQQSMLCFGRRGKTAVLRCGWLAMAGTS
jgi:hypothetical protein